MPGFDPLALERLDAAAGHARRDDAPDGVAPPRDDRSADPSHTSRSAVVVEISSFQPRRRRSAD